MTTQKYRQDSRTLLAQARSELAIGDVRQASEKGWGAAALMLKAVARTARLGTRQAPAPVPGGQPATGGNRRP